MKNNLCKEIRMASVWLKPIPAIGISNSLSIPKEFIPKIKEAEEMIENTYRKSIIEHYAKQNEVVRGNIEGKLKFYKVGEPIIQKAEKIYQSIKDSGKEYKFKRDEILKSPECLDSVRQLEGIVDVNNYFKNGKIQNKVFKTFADGLLGDNVLPRISRGLIVLALGGTIAFNLPSYQANGANITSLIFGFPALSTIFSYSNNNTPESLIKEPAEKFGKDLKWMDETFDRIYRGGGK